MEKACQMIEKSHPFVTCRMIITHKNWLPSSNGKSSFAQLEDDPIFLHFHGIVLESQSPLKIGSFGIRPRRIRSQISRQIAREKAIIFKTLRQ